MSEIHVPPATLDVIRTALSTAAAEIESTASSSPASIDGGEMTPLLTAMLATMVSNAATVSEGLTAVGSQVDAAEADFWTADAAVTSTFTGGGLRVD